MKIHQLLFEINIATAKLERQKISTSRSSSRRRGDSSHFHPTDFHIVTVLKTMRGVVMAIFKIIAGIAIFLIASTAYADGLKVFGPEFCAPYSAGSCINFHYKDLKEAKVWNGEYKYPKGRKAYDECVKNIAGSDGEYAYCSMIFHREEQSASKRTEMCNEFVRQKYWDTISGKYAMGMYDSVWGCKKQ